MNIPTGKATRKSTGGSFTNTSGVKTFVPKTFLEAKTKIYSKDLERLEVNVTDAGVDIYDLIYKLREFYYKFKNIIGESGEDKDLAIIEIETKAEKLLRERIRNQEVLKELIDKMEAVTRMLETLHAVNDMTQSAIKAVAEEFSGNKRDNIIKITKIFNTTFTEMVEKEGEILDWFEDGSKTLLETRILSKLRGNKELDSRKMPVRRLKSDVLGEIDV